MLEEKKELKEEDIRNVNGGFRVIDPSEDKELKDEDLNKVNGGFDRTHTGVWWCPKCDYRWNDDPSKSYEKCPECHNKNIIEVSD